MSLRDNISDREMGKFRNISELPVVAVTPVDEDGSAQPSFVEFPVETAKSLALDFHSQVIDFKDMSSGSVQMTWVGTDSITGTFKVYGSNSETDGTFDLNEVSDADIVVSTGSGSRIWRSVANNLSFRYVQVRWTGNGTTTGSVDITAIGKRS